MSTGPIATATVRIVPDSTGFRAALQAQIAAATKGLSASVSAGVSSGINSGLAGAAPAARTTSAALKGTAAAGLATKLGLKSATGESNALRGALIGLSRVTPVTVFGLGVYGTAGIAAGLAIKGAIKSTAEFEHELNVFQATTGATADEMSRVHDEAKALGADLTLPSTSAGDAAKAMTELAKAGLSVDQALKGARGTLQLAAAAQLDVGSAANFVATELNAFGLSGDKATHIADLLAGASIAAQGDIRDFATAFQQVSAVSRQVGLNVETTTGALTELAKAGLKGADGGTSLRTTLLRLTPTTKQAAEYQAALGIQLNKNLPIGKQLGDILDQYKQRLSVLNPIQRQQVLTQIAGQDAIRALSILVRGGSAALQENTDAANRNGAAAELAQANAKGLSGAFNGLKSNLDTLGITLGEFVKGPLTDVVNLLSVAVGGVNSFTGALKHLGGFRPFGLPIGTLIKEDLKFAIPGVGPGLVGRDAFNALFGSDKKDPGAPVSSAKVAANTINEQRTGGSSLSSNIDPLTKAEIAKERAAIEALIERRKKLKVRNADTNAPIGLSVNQLNAELDNNLKEELVADRAIENYFKQRLGRAIKGTARYLKILQAEQSANAATRSVQAQIDANAKAARDQALADAKQAAAEAKARQEAIFNLQKSRLDLAIQEAGLTKTKLDDIRTNRAEITFFQAQIKRIEAIRKKRKLTLDEQQALVDYRSSIVSLLSTIQDIKNKKKKGGDGFTLEDLFKESASQLVQFGSNVSTGVTLGGGARAAVAGAISARNPHLSAADRAKLLATGRTNDLLAEILAEISRQSTSKGEKSKSKATVRDLGGGVSYATDARSRSTAKRVRNG